MKENVLKCPTCQIWQKQEIPPQYKGQNQQRRPPAQIWQIRYVGPLPYFQGCQICVAVDTFSGYLIDGPFAHTTQKKTIKTLETIL